jgi:uncharacterized caspase-like protein
MPAWAQVQHMPRWRALILGVSTYDHAWPLPAATYDASQMSAALAGTRFGVTPPFGTGYLTRDKILDELDAFVATIAPGDVALVYFSGHGLNVNGNDYIVPSDKDKPTPDQVGHEGHIYVGVDYILGLISQKAGVAILILDNCRSDPFTPTAADTALLDLGNGAGAPTGAPGMGGGTPVATLLPSSASRSGIGAQIFVAYAAQPGHPAYSQFKGEPASAGSIFTRYLTKAIVLPGHPVDRSFGKAERDVVAITLQRQEPYQNQLGLGDVFLTADNPFDAEAADAWALAVQGYVQSGQQQYLTDFIGYYPTSVYAQAARNQLASQQAASSAATTAPTSGDLLVTGSLQSVGKSSNGTIVASVVRTTPLRQSWNSILPSGIVATLHAGDLVQLVRPVLGRAAALVATANGQIGYVGHVSIVATLNVHTTIKLRYVTGAIGSGLVNDAEIASSQAMLDGAKTTVQARIGPASGETNARSAQIAFVRALRLRQTLVSRGAKPERITMLYPDPTLAADTAEISLIQADR